jgi:hypothetical protein
MSDQQLRRSPNLDAAMRMLTDGTFSKMTGRKVKALTIQQAAALLGNTIHETGSPDLSDLDVVERGNGGAGRGLAQYTGPRREAYDKAMRGRNANDINTQMQYMAEEYVGKHDPGPGRSLVGYTRALETAPKDVAGATNHYLNNYFKPADRQASQRDRLRNAQQLEQLYAPSGGSSPPKPQARPKQSAQQPRSQPAVAKPQPKKKENRNLLQIFANTAPNLLRF